MFKWLMSYFKKNEEVKVEVEESNNIEYSLEHGNLDRVFLNGEPFQEEKLDRSKPTLLFVDDYIEMSTMLKNTISEMRDEYDVDLEERYNLIFAIGDNCGKDSLTFIENYPVDYAILDITLREIIQKSINGKISYGAIDGIDIGMEIKERYKECKILFLTAHNIDIDNYKFFHLHKKFHEAFGDELRNHYLNKLDPDRNKRIVEFVTGNKYDEE